MSKEEKIRRLRDDATELIEKGKHEPALKLYLELIKLEPDDPSWTKRAADCYRRLGKRKEELALLLRAANGYAQSGFVVKAVAMCKMALAIEPNNAAAQQQLEDLHTSRNEQVDAAKARQQAAEAAAQVAAENLSEVVITEQPAPQSLPPQSLVPSLAPRAALESVSLVPIISASALPQFGPGEGGVYELTLDAPKLPQGIRAPDAADVGRDWVEQSLTRTPLFDDVDSATLKALINRVELVHLEANDVLFHEGDEADSMYVVADGEMVAEKTEPEVVHLGRLMDGDFFGEIGILSDQARQATLRATRPTELLRLDRILINELIAGQPGFLEVVLRFLRARLVRGLMLTSPMFSRLDAADQGALGKQFKFLEIDPGTVLVAQRAKAEGLFVLLGGRAVVRREHNDEVTELGKLHAGDLFGEMSLLDQKPAVASVTTETRVFCLFLPAQEFHKLVMVNPLVLEFVSSVAAEREAELEASGFRKSRMSLI